MNLPLPETITSLTNLLTEVLVFTFELITPLNATLPVVVMPSTCIPATKFAAPFVIAELKVFGVSLNQPLTGDVINEEIAAVEAASTTPPIDDPDLYAYSFFEVMYPPPLYAYTHVFPNFWSFSRIS